MSNNNNNQQQQQEIIPDAPIMRSMMVRSAAPSIPLRSEPLAKEPLASTRTTKIAPMTKDPVVWDLDETTVMPLPSVYMLERTHVTVEASPSEVARRVSDSLRRESIFACYKSKEVRCPVRRNFSESTNEKTNKGYLFLQALVEAETRENVRFILRLWKKNSQEVIVEAQKIDGCCFLYCQAAKAVLRAAKGLAAVPKRKFALPACVPRDTEDEQKANIKSGLNIASTMLKSDRLDAHMMAIDTLLHISKATQNPSFAAHCILCGEFRSTLLALVECCRMNHDQAETPLGESEQKMIALMHRNAVAIIANCLKSLQDSRELVQVISQQEELSSNDFLAALVEDVSACNERPHDACEAARCLHPLMYASTEIRRKVMDLGAEGAVGAASQEGACRHALLDNACAKLRCEM